MCSKRYQKIFSDERIFELGSGIRVDDDGIWLFLEVE
jgi:hypothetical protein